MTDNASVEFVQDACGVNRERARELLEAGGSVERVIDICFHKPTPAKRKHSPSSSQKTLSSFILDKTNTKRKASNKSKDCVTPDTNTTQTASSKSQNSKPRKFVTTTTTTSDDNSDPRLEYGALAHAFDKMVATTKRNAKLEHLQQVLTNVIEALGGLADRPDRESDAYILTCALELILGTFSLNVSGSAVSKAIQAVTGVSATKLREAYRATGDLGNAAESFVRNQTLLIKPKPLSIQVVHNALKDIAAQQGKGSQQQRHSLMVKLLRSCQNHEMKFLVRTFLGNMRLGANTRTVLAALAIAVEQLDASSCQREAYTAAAIKSLQSTFDILPRLDKITLALLRGGISRMTETCDMQVGTPVNPMLANPAHSLDQVEKLMSSGGAVVAEWKYDGVRCQAHWDGTSIKLFSRNMLDKTEQFPLAVEAVLKARNDCAKTFIIDSEIVGVKGSRLLPFQDLSTRRDGQTVRIRVHVFDLIYANGESLANKSLWRRQQILRECFHETDDFVFAQSISLASYDEAIVRDFLKVAIKDGAEGLMVKLTGENTSKEASTVTKTDDSVSVCPYEAGVRSQTWLKVKRDYVGGFADTIDVVPIGAWYGNGRKAQKNFLSPVLLAVYDEEDDVFRSISRCMSFSDAMYDAMREFYFRGTPYPPGVGVADDVATNSVDDKSTVEAQEESVNDEATKSDEEWVNCYQTRPSSAVVVTNESPPIWFKPMEVFEVSFADLTLSTTHTAAAGLVEGSSRGVALRFPRFKRRRPDKRVEEATTCAHIAQLFAQQSKIMSK